MRMFNRKTITFGGFGISKKEMKQSINFELTCDFLAHDGEGNTAVITKKVKFKVKHPTLKDLRKAKIL